MPAGNEAVQKKICTAMPLGSEVVFKRSPTADSP